jgi:hypothetical protein
LQGGHDAAVDRIDARAPRHTKYLQIPLTVHEPRRTLP